MPRIERIWDGRPRWFDLGDLETAWLVIAEYLPDHDGRGLERLSVRSTQVADSLQWETGWDRGKVLLYLVAAAHWDGRR